MFMMSHVMQQCFSLLIGALRLYRKSQEPPQAAVENFIENDGISITLFPCNT